MSKIWYITLDNSSLIQFIRWSNIKLTYIGLLSKSCVWGTMDESFSLLWQVLMENIEEYAPIVYTPTVGLVCQKYSGLFRRPRGMYFSAEDRGEMMSMVYNWPADQVCVYVNQSIYQASLVILGRHLNIVVFPTKLMWTSLSYLVQIICTSISSSIHTDAYCFEVPLIKGLKKTVK